MTTETEVVQEPEVESPIEALTEGSNQETAQAEPQAEQQVPLSALQKERRKRQEAEKRAQLYEDIQAQQLREKQQANPSQDEDLYEAATKADLKKIEANAIRAADERSWIRQNPERAAEVNEKLTEFLKQRPHLAAAIEAAPNRYEEAWLLMDALTPKQKIALKAAPVRKEAPNSPGAVPKSASMNQAVDVMSMTDSEYLAWRKAQKKVR